MNSNSKLYYAMLFTPYIAVIIGLYLFSNAWVAVGLYHLGIFGLLLFFKYKIRNWFTLKLTWNTLISTGFSALAGLLIFLLWDYIRIPTLNLTFYLTKVGLNKNCFGLFVIYFAAVHPVLEEMYWRGLMINLVKPPLLTDFCFAGYHSLVLLGFIRFEFIVASLVILMYVSMVWRYFIEKHNEYWTALFSHASADLSIILAVYLKLG